MEVVTASACPRPEQGTVVTIGAYDGVHLGHRVLLDEVQRLAKGSGMQSAVVTFDRHPATVVRPSSAPQLLTDLDQKLELLAATGVDYALVVTFDEARAHQAPEDFVDELVCDCLRARAVVVGSDFHFGYKRRGNVDLLESVGRRRGFEVVGMKLVAHSGEVVSSTRIRGLISAGQVAGASRLLGRWHEVRGRVERGDARGGPALGYPTANVRVASEVLLPADGIYAGYLETSAGEPHRAAVYVGRRPTFFESARESLVEAHLLDFSGDLYGSEARVRFVAKLRDDQRFGSAQELIAQMERDVDAARAALAGHDATISQGS